MVREGHAAAVLTATSADGWRGSKLEVEACEPRFHRHRGSAEAPSPRPLTTRKARQGLQVRRITDPSKSHYHIQVRYLTYRSWRQEANMTKRWQRQSPPPFGPSPWRRPIFRAKKCASRLDWRSGPRWEYRQGSPSRRWGRSSLRKCRMTRALFRADLRTDKRTWAALCRRRHWSRLGCPSRCGQP